MPARSADGVEREQAQVAHGERHGALRDALREPLGDGRLADAGRPDERGIVLALPEEDVDRARDLLVAAAHDLEPAGARVGGEVAGEAVEGSAESEHRSGRIKDFLAGLRLLDNRADQIAWYRLLRLHDGIGPARARSLLTLLRPADTPDRDQYAEAIAAAPATARIKLTATLTALAAARDHRTTADRVAAIVAMLRPLLTRRYPDHHIRLEDLNRLAAAAAPRPAWPTTSPG